MLGWAVLYLELETILSKNQVDGESRLRRRVS
jgi:hypothetical protein